MKYKYQQMQNIYFFLVLCFIPSLSVVVANSAETRLVSDAGGTKRGREGEEGEREGK